MELGLNTIPPEEETQTGGGNTVDTQPQGQETTQAQAPEDSTDTSTETPSSAQTTEGSAQTGKRSDADSFIESFNKRYNTQYKSDDEVKALFEVSKKIPDYETKLKDFESIQESVAKKEKEIEDLKSLNDPLKYFSSPEAYKAEQLKIKYPDRDAVVLQEVVTTDVDNMDDFDLLMKAERLFNKKLPEGGRYVKDVLYKRYGLDSDLSPAEWDGATKTQIAMDANVWRNRINDLKKEIDLPEVVTPEQREQQRLDYLAKKEQDLDPIKDKFINFDKFTHPEVEGFEWQPTSDYKAKAEEMFKGMFVDADMPMNKDNMAAALRLRDATLLYENFPKIREAIIKEAQVALRAEIDAESHSDAPPNTQTATDQDSNNASVSGIAKLVDDLQRR